MRYVAVFTLFSIPVAKGFGTITEAVNCLDQADEDLDSSALGVYDITMSKVIFYRDEDYATTNVEENLIVNLARAYIERIA